MHPCFRNNTELGYYWIHEFGEEGLVDTVHLFCEDTLYFEFVSLMFHNENIVSYARDALHYALVAHKHDDVFWDFLFADTYNMEPLFGLDQVDIVVLVLLILERLNHEGFNFPTVCYDLSAARWSQQNKTGAMHQFLKTADFESAGLTEVLLTDGTDA
jgi:hypothetical protein